MTETDIPSQAATAKGPPPTIRFRTSADERDQIAASARAAGLSVSAYVRHMALNGRVNAAPRKTADQPETVSQLLKIGNNLNQIAKGGNQLGVVDRQELADVVSQIRAAVEFLSRD